MGRKGLVRESKMFFSRVSRCGFVMGVLRGGWVQCEMYVKVQWLELGG